MKNLKKRFTSKQNNRGLFSRQGIFVLLAIFALLAVTPLFTDRTSAQQNTCTPTTTVTEGDLFPGGIASFAVTSGPGSVTVDHVNTGTGLRSLTVVGVPTNAVVNIPAFTPGTFDPAVVTFSVINPALPVDFTLRAANTFHAIFIRVRCAGVPTPTPTATPTPTRTPTPTPTPPIQGCTFTQGYWKNHADLWPVQSLTLGTVTYTKSQLLSIFETPVRGNGLISLSHQLIAAKLNAAAGTTVPASVAAAIAAADTLIGGLIVPPVGSGFLSPDATSSVTSTLDTYNNGNTLGGPPHCDD